MTPPMMAGAPPLLVAAAPSELPAGDALGTTGADMAYSPGGDNDPGGSEDASSNAARKEPKAAATAPALANAAATTAVEAGECDVEFSSVNSV